MPQVTVDLSEDILAKIGTIAKKKDVKHIEDIVQIALEEYINRDLEVLESPLEESRQIHAEVKNKNSPTVFSANERAYTGADRREFQPHYREGT